MRDLEKIFHLCCNIGILQTLVNLSILKFYNLLSNLGFKVKNRTFYFYIKGYLYPVFLRYGTSDFSAFFQTFATQEESCLDNVNDPKLIIDCGAYVGYSSVYFLNKYPNAYVIAVEPEETNYSICQKNLYPYGKRATLIRSAIWPHNRGVVICKGQSAEKHEWATQVREPKGEEKPDTPSIDIETLIKKSGFEIVDILKIDIEEAELELFSYDYEKWLNRVRNIVIEIHNKECERIFFKAFSSYNYELSISGESKICKNISPKIKEF